MSIEALTHVLSLNVGDSTRKLVLIGYANHAHRDGRNAWASVETIAKYANCSTRTVQRHVAQLVADGFMREGDQTLVAHLRGDRRPIVYDVAMSEEQRLAWQEAAKSGTGVRAAAAERGRRRRGDNLTPGGEQPVEPGVNLSPGRGDSLTPREPERGDTGDVNGVTPVTQRGDIAVSPKPSVNRHLEPDGSLASLGNRADSGSTVVQPTLDGTTPPPPEPKEPTVRDRAFGIARDWIQHRTDAGTPPVMRGGNPLHAIAKLVEPALEAGYSDLEVKHALALTDTSLPTAQQFERALAAVRNGVRAHPTRPGRTVSSVNEKWDRFAAQQRAASGGGA